ncbi:MAG: 2-C-methyl-D-erythritol 2,4-cyclodiphosphate synthase [Clostridia bacterium]|nr:2-C-methyl-D-erythritol 2,4-cyclodiphosphate synthase [Clostridia bacterium]
MKKKYKAFAIVLSAGSGKRMESDTPKTLLPINSIPAIIYSLNAFISSDYTDEIIIVCPKGETLKYEQLLKEYNLFGKAEITEGGEERSDSVYSGLLAAEGKCDYVMIHDAARPMINEECIGLCMEKCIEKGSAIAAKPLVNTLKKVSKDKIENNIDREGLWEVYTPQCFAYAMIRKAYDNVIKNNIPVTDDAGAMEKIGAATYVVAIPQRDFKLTTPDDIELVEKLLMNNDEIRVGIGFDVHKFAENRKLVLGGVEIPYKKGLLGHSDADVLTHAIMDSILGAASLPDIGSLFPDTSDKFKGIYSIKLLEKVYEEISKLGFTINNIDAVVACEEPKISAYRADMIKRISNALRCEADRINIKGTTTEKLGFEGRGEGISARSIASLKKTKG